MKIFKKLCAFSLIILTVLSLFACSWEDVTVTPTGDPIVNPGSDNDGGTGGSTGGGSGGGTGGSKPLASNGTYGLVYDEGLDFCVVTGYHGTEADVFIPAEWNNKPVTGINSFSFNENSAVKSITMTSAITSIGKNALVGEYNVFCEVDYTECDDETCQDKHPPIGWHKDWCTNPELVEWNCGNFGSFSWETNEDDNIVITGYIKNPVTLTIPEKIGTRTVVAIKTDAFNDCASLEEITLPDSIEKIGNFAFRFCTSLKTIVIPEAVTVIPNSAFEGCDALESVKISSKTEKIESKAFADCPSLKRIDIPKTVNSIGSMAFLNNRALEIHFVGFSTVPASWSSTWNVYGGKIVTDTEDEE